MNKQTTFPQLEPLALDTDPASQKLNLVKWLEVTLPVPWFRIM